MSKAAKQSIFILVFLLLGSLGFTGYTLVQQKALEQQKANTEQQLAKAKENEKKQATTIGQLEQDLKKAAEDKASIEQNLRRAQADAQDLSSKIQKLTSDVSTITQDRDKWKQRIDALTKERDALEDKLNNQPEKIVYKEREPVKIVEPEDEDFDSEDSTSSSTFNSPPSQSQAAHAALNNQEEYWASVLRDKAALEVNLNNLKEDLSKKSYELVEIKQANANLQLELDNIKHGQEDLDREIKYKSDLINNLSIELARTKNDKKFIAERVKELNGENTQLRQDVQKMIATKSALEKSVVKITQDKEKVTRQLIETDGLIQGKIDEIWDIKDSIDQSFKSTRVPLPSASDVELPPIVVSGTGITSIPSANFDTGASKPGFDGKVVTINNENNFVIINIGEDAKVRLGETLSVYRDSKYIARLEVIQVRKDISAADIKEQSSKIKVGDSVR